MAHKNALVSPPCSASCAAAPMYRASCCSSSRYLLIPARSMTCTDLVTSAACMRLWYGLSEYRCSSVARKATSLPSGMEKCWMSPTCRRLHSVTVVSEWCAVIASNSKASHSDSWSHLQRAASTVGSESTEQKLGRLTAAFARELLRLCCEDAVGTDPLQGGVTASGNSKESDILTTGAPTSSASISVLSLVFGYQLDRPCITTQR
jgi:hypothetical protein